MILAITTVALTLANAGNTLDWSAPEECPGAQFMLAEVNRHLEKPLDEQSVDVHVHAYVQPIAGTWKLEVVVSRGSWSRREVDFGADCWELTARMAWVIAIDLEPLGKWHEDDAPLEPYQRDEPDLVPVRTTPSRTIAPSSQPPGSPAVQFSDEPPDLVPEERPANVQGVIGLAAGANANLFPNVVAGADLRGGVQIHWARILALANYWGGGLYLSNQRRVGAELLAWNLGVEGCGAPFHGAFDLQLCASVAGGGVRARGIGDLLSPRTAHRPWLLAGLRIQAAWLVRPPVALVLSVGGNLNAMRPKFEIATQPLQYVTPTFGATATAGVEFRFSGNRKAER